MPRSFSIVGIKGAKMILAIKFRKKINARKRRGPDCERNDKEFSFSPVERPL